MGAVREEPGPERSARMTEESWVLAEPQTRRIP